MYIPDHFRMPEEDTASFLRDVRRGTLVTVDASTHRPMATFLPWAMAQDGRLTSHIGTINPQTAHTGEALVVLMGDDGYISDEWTSGAVPTWNYETVHIYGEYRTHTDPEWIINSWSDMLKRFSARTIDDYDPAWLEIQARSVTGVEVIITEIQAKSKLSQNRSEPDVRSIISHLEPTCPHLAERMGKVSLPHIAQREERVRNAVAYSL